MRCVLAMILLSQLLPVTVAAAEDRLQHRPNVVLFLVDDMGWTDCGVQGSKYYETPRIDRFAAQGMRFTNAYAQPLCSPTRASILTGQYSARHRVTSATGHLPPQPADHTFLPDAAPADVPMLLPESRNYLDPELLTLAKLLRASGYRTGHIGKWHLGTTEPHWPERHGFETAFHCHPDPGPPGGYFSPYRVLPAGATRPANKGAERWTVGTITDGPTGEYIVDRQADEAVKFIQRHKQDPFFLNLWCYGVHGPWGHKEELTRTFLDKKDPTGRQGNPIMASMLKSVDDCFGRILDELDRQGLLDETIVIFTSDNGGNTHSNTTEQGRQSASPDWRKWAGLQSPTNNSPLRDGKGTLYEGGTRVPLMWAWPRRIAPWSTSDAVVGPIDIYPTLAELLEIPLPQEHTIDGESYAAVLTENGPLRRTAYFNYHPHAGANRAGGVWVRSGDFKLIRWFGNPETLELYDLREDPGESRNLVETAPDKARELNALIDGFLRNTGATYPRPNPAYRPTAAKMPSDLLTVWKPRGCQAAIADGVLTIKGTGKPGEAFLGHACGALSGPATVILRLRSAHGGQGRIDLLPQGAAAPDEKTSTPFPVPAGDWSTIKIALPHAGRMGVMRVFLPVDNQALDIDKIDIVPAKGAAEKWDF